LPGKLVGNRRRELKALTLTAALPLLEFVAARTVRRLKMRRWRKAFRALMAKQAGRPVYGPEALAVPSSQVDGIEEFLAVCRDLEESASSDETAVYRGQSHEFQLASTGSVSLLPWAARSPRTAVPRTWRMEQAYRAYLRTVAHRHLGRLAQTQQEELFFREMVHRYGMASTPEGRFLADTPPGRFLRRLYPMMPDPWLLEAALHHYGFPTHALDATHSPLVALYFALHSLEKGAGGVLEFVPRSSGGVVYVMFVPKSSPYRRGIVEWPRIVDLYDMTLDNFSRPRRQFAVFLPEAGYLELDDPPQSNAYSLFIRRIIRFSPRFYKSPDVREFLHAGLGAWLFPPIGVDLLYRNLRSASRRWFPVYSVGEPKAGLRPDDQFEFTRPRRIVLTGSDVEQVRAVLIPTWHSRMGWIESLPVPHVLRLASTSGGPEPLDIVIACEPFLKQSAALQERIHDAGYSHGRLFVVLSTGVLGDVQPRHQTLAIDIGGVPYLTTNDPYDADYALQNSLFDAQLELSRVRYQRRMKPEPEHWRSFLEWARAGQPP
jgi:FRG domain